MTQAQIQLLNEVELGGYFEGPLLVKDAEIKRTKKNSPYLRLTLFDSEIDISANIWDWIHPAPAINTVFQISGRIAEYEGTRQLNISRISTPRDPDISMFVPQDSEMDINWYLERYQSLIDDISHPELSDICQRLFDTHCARWRIVPGALKVHHAFVAGALKHSVDVAVKAKLISELYLDCNTSLCIAGALLHDIGKIASYEQNGAVFEATLAGNLLDHIVLGILLVGECKTTGNEGQIMLLQHIIASHHGQIEWGAAVPPKCKEAYIIHFMDNLDAKMQTIQELNKKASPTAIYTAKEWSLDNRKMVTQEAIKQLLDTSGDNVWSI